MNHRKTVACMLAALFCSVPFAACSKPESEEVALPSEQITAIPPVEEPELPPTEEEPEVPEEQDVPVAPPAVPEEPKSDYVKVLANGLNVRAGAGTQYSSRGTVQNEILLKYISREGSWYQTYYCGSIAYVSADARYTAITSLKTGKEAVESVIEEGLKYLGVPYVYGATRCHDGKGNTIKGFTANAFDCSSLMQYIFYKGAGVLLQMTTRTQIAQGKEVARADIRRGDLLFFTNASRKNNAGIERVGHVALYLGDNYILHTASDYAKAEQISSLRWSYFISARRIL